MRAFIVGTALVALLGAFQSAGADAGADPPRHNPLLALPRILSGEAKIKRSQRIQFASHLLRHFRQIDSVVVGLSPEQRQWLDREYFDVIKEAGNRYTQKSLDVHQTVEYSTFIVKDVWLYNALPILQWLADDNPAHYIVLSEITYWSWLCKRFTAGVDMQQALQNLTRRNPSLKKVLDDRELGDLEFYALNLALRAGEIHETIIEPWMMGQLRSD